MSRTKSWATLQLEKMETTEQALVEAWAAERVTLAPITYFTASRVVYEDYQDWFESRTQRDLDRYGLSILLTELESYGLNPIRFSLMLKKLQLAIPDKSGGKAVLRKVALKSD